MTIYGQYYHGSKIKLETKSYGRNWNIRVSAVYFKCMSRNNLKYSRSWGRPHDTAHECKVWNSAPPPTSARLFPFRRGGEGRGVTKTSSLCSHYVGSSLMKSTFPRNVEIEWDQPQIKLRRIKKATLQTFSQSIKLKTVSRTNDYATPNVTKYQVPFLYD